MSCCHYDEGYEDGQEDALENASAVSDLLSALAYRYSIAGCWEKVGLIEEIERDIAGRDLERIAERERERVAKLEKLFTASRAA